MIIILGTILGWIIVILITLEILGFLITGLSWCVPDIKDLFCKYPDEITVEIVREDNAKPLDGQTGLSSQPSKELEPSSSSVSSRPREKEES